MVMASFLWADLHGGTATATVVRVYSQTGYTISFTTMDGVRCETSTKWSPRAETVEVQDTFEVHYSRNSPCDNVARADDGFARYGGYLIPPVFVIAGLIRIMVIKRRPDPQLAP